MAAHNYHSAQVDSAFYPPRETKMSISHMAALQYKWRRVNIRPIAAYQCTQRSSLQLGLRVGCHLALTDCHLHDSSELSHMAW